MTLYVTRHAQPVSPAEYDGEQPHDRPLSTLGVEQATALGTRMAAMEFAGPVLASPFRRCLETADRLCAAADRRFRPEPAIAEVGGGWSEDFEGLTADEIRSAYSRCEDDVAALPDPWWPTESESPAALQERVGAFLDRRLPATETDLLLVGHGATTGAVVRHLCGTDVDSALTGSAGYGLHYNAALTAIDSAGEPTLAFGNDTAHLDAGQVTSNATVMS